MKFGTSRTQIIAAIYRGPGLEGGWNVELNSDTLLRVLVNELCKELSKAIGNPVEMTYFSDRLRQMKPANDL